MVKSFWIALFVMMAGLVLVILPDQEKSVFNFNKNHGPSIRDISGLILIVISWAFMIVRLVFKRKVVLNALGTRNVTLMILIVLAGNTLIFGGLRIEKDIILWTGVLMSVLAYAVLFIPAFRTS